MAMIRFLELGEDVLSAFTRQVVVVLRPIGLDEQRAGRSGDRRGGSGRGGFD